MAERLLDPPPASDIVTRVQVPGAAPCWSCTSSKLVALYTVWVALKEVSGGYARTPAWASRRCGRGKGPVGVVLTPHHP